MRPRARRFTVICWSTLAPGPGRFAYLGMVGGVTMREPNKLEHAIVALTNRTLCAIFGHDRTLEKIPEVHKDGMFPCTACCKNLPVTHA